MRRTALAGGCLLLAVATGCADGASSGTDSAATNRDGSGSFSVDVASPDLVRMKQQAGMANCPSSDRSAARSELPQVTLPCLGGGRDVRLAGIATPAVINVWASYCAPCREELPVLQQLHEAAGDRLTMLGVDYEDTSPAAALKLASDAGVTYPSVADPDAELRADLKVIALPQTVFVGADGSVVAIERRQLTSYDMAAGLVEQHLGLELPDRPVGA